MVNVDTVRSGETAEPSIPSPMLQTTSHRAPSQATCGWTFGSSAFGPRLPTTSVSNVDWKKAAFTKRMGSNQTTRKPAPLAPTPGRALLLGESYVIPFVRVKSQVNVRAHRSKEGVQLINP